MDINNNLDLSRRTDTVTGEQPPQRPSSWQERPISEVSQYLRWSQIGEGTSATVTRQHQVRQRRSSDTVTQNGRGFQVDRDRLFVQDTVAQRTNATVTRNMEIRTTKVQGTSATVTRNGRWQPNLTISQLGSQGAMTQGTSATVTRNGRWQPNLTIVQQGSQGALTQGTSATVTRKMELRDTMTQGTSATVPRFEFWQPNQSQQGSQGTMTQGTSATVTQNGRGSQGTMTQGTSATVPRFDFWKPIQSQVVERVTLLLKGDNNQILRFEFPEYRNENHPDHTSLSEHEAQRYRALIEPTEQPNRCGYCFEFYTRDCKKKHETPTRTIESPGPWSTHATFKNGVLCCPKLIFCACEKCGNMGEKGHPDYLCCLQDTDDFMIALSNYYWRHGDEEPITPTSSNSSPTTSNPNQHKKCCSFCYNLMKTRNESQGQPVPERDDFGPWSTHSIVVNKIVTCPLLWTNTCGICEATRDEAHTTNHCPQNQRE